MIGRVERIGAATLYLGDWRDADWSGVDVVLTDPPFGRTYRSGHATPDLWKGGMAIIGDATTHERDTAIAAFGSAAMLVFGSTMVERPKGLRAVLIWDKGPALGMGALDIPWKPSFEEIYLFGYGWQGKRDEGAVIYCPPVQSMAKNGRQHPNQKPTSLLKKLLRKMPAGMVADPFMGSGSTGVACIEMGRPFVGAEIEPKYFDIACRRIEQAQRQSDLFIKQPEVA